MSTTANILIAIIAGIAALSPLYSIIRQVVKNSRPTHKLEIKSKSGAKVVFDLDKPNGIKKVLQTADILLGH